MSSISVEMLAGWPERWRYPQLLVRLADADRPLARDELARLIVEGIADQATPTGSIRALIAAGEFAVAERLLEAPDISTLAGTEADVLADELVQARSAAAAELHTRLLALRSRAAEVDVRGVPDSVADATDARRHEGDMTLAKWEAEVAIKEREWEQRIRARLAEIGAAGGDDAAAHHLGRSIDACLKANQLRAAEYLLRHHTQPAAAEGDAWPAALGGSLRANPYDVAAIAPWPWRLPIADVLAWYQHPDQAPPDFHARWRAADADAIELVSAIGEFVAAGVPTTRLCAAIDRATGCEPTVDGQALETTADPLLAPLAFFAGQAVRVRAPGDDEAPSALILAASPEEDAGGPWLAATDLLRIVGQHTDRRVHLLRLIGAQLPLGRALRPEEAATLPAMTPAELRLYIDWILDLLDVRVDAVFTDVLTGLAAGFVQPALVLLDEFLSTAAARTEIADVTTLHEVTSASSAFSAACRSAVLGPLADTSPLVRAIVVVLAWYDPTGTDPQSLAGVHEILELSEVDRPDDADLAAAVWTLKRLGMVEETDAGYCVYPDVARLVRTLIPDVDAYVASGCPPAV